MLRIALKGLLARKLRLFTTSLAVLLGVAFMSGTLVLTDTMGRTFDTLFADATAGVDAAVRGKAVISSDFAIDRDRVPASLVDTVRGTDGVAAVEGFVEGYAQVVGRDGKAVGNPGMGAPTFGRNWATVAELNPFRLVRGAAPANDGEVVLDRYTAKEAGVAVGDTVRVLTERGPVSVRVSGIAKFGDADGTGGATNVLFTSAAAQRHVGAPGSFDSIAAVAADGVSQAELRDRIAARLPGSAEVITGRELTEENQSTIRKSLRFFNTFLFTFAVVALLVGSFIIYNTFSIIVAQRGREMALMRAVGASRRQVLTAVLVEAVAVGVLASVLGMLAGVGVAALLKALLAGFGIDIPAGGIVFRPNTAVTSLVVGVGVSVLSALFPARRAAKVPPVAAMRDLAVESTGIRRRTIVAGLVTAAGAAALLTGLFASDGEIKLVGLGAVLVFFGVAGLGPVIATPVARAIGSPLPRLRGMAGTLARENAVRNPKRTSATAAALMIGVGLVAFITIFAASAKQSIGESIDQAFTGDFVVDSGSFGFGGLSPDLAAALARLPEVRAVTGYRIGQAKVEGATKFLSAVDPATVGDIVDLDIVQGRLADLDATAVAVEAEIAANKGLAIGDPVRMTFARTGERTLTVRAIFERADIGGQYLLPISAFEANFATQFDARVFVAKARDVPAAEARAAVERVAKAYPNAKLQDQTQFKEAQAAQINQLLALIYVLLALAVFIALLGIANTLALSIFERTRELGLLRAVGMTRAQLRTAVRWESVIIALFGTALGLVIGLFFGWALVQALRNEGFTSFRVPPGQLLTVVVVAAVAGVVAAIGPGRRAARLDVLRAIATE
ncbi:MAG TPA: FtsX-like permease family protein [Mycobacteriales bacterium]